MAPCCPAWLPTAAVQAWGSATGGALRLFLRLWYRRRGAHQLAPCSALLTLAALGRCGAALWRHTAECHGSGFSSGFAQHGFTQHQADTGVEAYSLQPRRRRQGATSAGSATKMSLGSWAGVGVWVACFGVLGNPAFCFKVKVWGEGKLCFCVWCVCVWT